MPASIPHQLSLLLLTVASLVAALPLHAQFGGGPGDGHDQFPLLIQLVGYDDSGLFAGGPGDGHDQSVLIAQLTGADVSGLFAGGSGDGHDQSVLIAQLTGTDVTGLFAGGAGDGHDMAELVVGLLPLTLLTFEAVPGDKYVLLRWVTTDERDTDYFVVERSPDGQSFDDLPERVPAASFSEPGEELHYELRDELPLDGVSYYRLRSVDLDESFSLSALRRVAFTGATDWDFTLYPNPNDGRQLNVRLSGDAGQDGLWVQLIDATGRVMVQQPLSVAGNETAVSLPQGKLTAGSYGVRVLDGAGEGRAKVLVVKRR